MYKLTIIAKVFVSLTKMPFLFLQVNFHTNKSFFNRGTLNNIGFLTEEYAKRTVSSFFKRYSCESVTLVGNVEKRVLIPNKSLKRI